MFLVLSSVYIQSEREASTRGRGCTLNSTRSSDSCHLDNKQFHRLVSGSATGFHLSSLESRKWLGYTSVSHLWASMKLSWYNDSTFASVNSCDHGTLVFWFAPGPQHFSSPNVTVLSYVMGMDTGKISTCCSNAQMHHDRSVECFFSLLYWLVFWKHFLMIVSTCWCFNVSSWDLCKEMSETFLPVSGSVMVPVIPASWCKHVVNVGVSINDPRVGTHCSSKVVVACPSKSAIHEWKPSWFTCSLPVLSCKCTIIHCSWYQCWQLWARILTVSHVQEGRAERKHFSLNWIEICSTWIWRCSSNFHLQEAFMSKENFQFKVDLNMFGMDQMLFSLHLRIFFGFCCDA